MKSRRSQAAAEHYWKCECGKELGSQQTCGSSCRKGLLLAFAPKQVEKAGAWEDTPPKGSWLAQAGGKRSALD